jgi:signal transduction histidine kinase
MRIEQSEFHDQLVRGLTHKMNNILSLFHGYLGLLIDDKKLDRDTMAGLLRIRDSADSSSQWRQIAPDEFLRSLLPSLNLFADRGVRIEVDCDPDIAPLWADNTRLRVALKEIVKNACEASPAKGTVIISVKPHARGVRTKGRVANTPPITWTAITVADTGKGIPRDLNEKIFQPFFSTKSKLDSMGLGLSVALGLIQQLGGAIRFQSRPGKTHVKILLPSRAA